MEIKYIQLYDCQGRGANTKFGKIMEEFEYENGYWVPTVGDIIRCGAVTYQVVAVIYNISTKLIRIKMEKLNDEE